MKNNYHDDLQLYLKRKILLSKKINLLQIEESRNQYVEKQDVLKFDRNTLNDFTLIKINYDKSK
jgi:hypothetical protein